MTAAAPSPSPVLCRLASRPGGVLHWVHEGVFPEIVIIRGLPGSGKSTAAVHNFPLHVHCEADGYHTDDETGVYNFVQENAGKAHAYCQGMVNCALALGYPVVVSNTTTTHAELEPYRRLAEKYGVRLRVFVATGDYGNVHGVPDEVIEKMRDRWESVEGEVRL